MHSIEEIFNKGLELHHFTNTAYPLNGKKVLKDYRVSDEKVDEIVINEWKKVQELGLYVHIPFCEKRCLYCEYTVLSGEEANAKEEYVNLLKKEISKYKPLIAEKKVVGLDFGGGTPTALNVDAIREIKDLLLNGLSLAENFGISIETTPKIAATDAGKLAAIRDLGIERISMGMQTIDAKILKDVGREDNSMAILENATNNIREARFGKLNIDLMYGFAHQSMESWVKTIEFAVSLQPEYITLYRNRYKGTRLEKDYKDVSLDEVNLFYSKAHQFLNEKGFKANLGKNTFSRIDEDPGTSAYLTKRVIEGTPYLGMGLGAQGLTNNALYYNSGAGSKRLGQYREKLSRGSFPIQDFYMLPIEEVMAKVICVSFYFGYIDKEAFKKRFDIALEDKFAAEMNFLLKNDYMKDEGDLLMLTAAGKDAINGIIPLFYSKNSRENMFEYRK